MNGSPTKFEQAFSTLKDEILNGKWTCNGPFPSVVAISRRFGVAHLTAVKIVDALKRVGLVHAVYGKGTFVSRRRRALGLIVPALPRVEIFSPICHAFSDLCQEHDWLLYFADECSESSEKVRDRVLSLVDKLIGEQVAGVVFHPVDYCANAAEINGEVVERFRRAGIPLVLLDADFVSADGTTGLDMVGIDNVEIGATLGRHVLERGAKRILFVKRTCWSENVCRRFTGLRGVFADVRGAKVVECNVAGGVRTPFARALRASRPQAVVCSSDAVAAQILRWLRELKLHVPEDVMVTGVNDVEIARVTEPALTTIHQPCEAIARAAFDLLQWRMTHGEDEARHVFVRAPLVVRASTERTSGK